MKKRIVFIINTNSGISKKNKIEELIKNRLNLNIFDYSVEYTKYHKHATNITNKLINNTDIIVAVGGDGTINEISSSIINTNIILGIIPTGSGNGIARHFKIPIDINKSIDIINNLRYKIIDTAKLNNQTFVMLSGFGFDSKIAYKFKTNKKRGFWGYTKLIFKNIFSYKSEEYDITIDNTNYKKRAYLITVANCSQFGNDVFIAPDAVEDDNLLDVVIIKDISVYKILGVFFRLFNKSIGKSKNVDIYRGRNIKIKQKNKSAQIDGESIVSGNDINIEINPKSLKLIY